MKKKSINLRMTTEQSFDYEKDYKEGDALLLYMMLDNTSDYKHLYADIKRELQSTFLEPAELARKEIDKINFFHARDNKVEQHIKNWISASTLKCVAHYANNLIYRSSQVQITQIDSAKIVTAFHMKQFLKIPCIHSRLIYLGTPVHIIDRFTNEDEYILILNKSYKL